MEKLLDELLKASSPDREKILAREFGDNEDLKRQALTLLANRESAEFGETTPLPTPNSSLEFFAAATHARDADSTANRSAQIPFINQRYELTKLIGFGGMGAVWHAEQKSPVKRAVAIKLIKRSGASEQVIRRFEAERQALALMDHPYIARIFDGGTTESGEPYFVMELVDGIPLTEFCDRERLSIRARLELFNKVCQGVQHAHQKGILHRDLKPGNILVSRVDGEPVPKVIDFGVAKALDQRLTDESLHETELIVGTPAYMSPEQADAAVPDIDTRTDIYSLGVILYELLVGLPPLDARDFKRGAIHEMLRMVREVDPPRPSTRFSQNKNADSVSANRSMAKLELMRSLRTDIDWIVMKALEKDRNRRYDSVAGFVSDVQRFLTNQPVDAHPPSKVYLAKKFVRRNRGLVLATTLLSASLIAGLVGTVTGLVKANAARKDAEIAQKSEQKRADSEAAARQSEEQAKLLAEQRQHEAEEATLLAEQRREETEAALQRAQIESDWAQTTLNFLVNDVIRQADSYQQNAIGDVVPNLTIREAIDRAAARIDERTASQPHIAPALRGAVGEAYLGLGQYKQSITQLEKALEESRQYRGPMDSFTLGIERNLAYAYHLDSQFDKAVPLFVDVMDSLAKLNGEADETVLLTALQLSICHRERGEPGQALPIVEKASADAIEHLGEDHSLTGYLEVELASTLLALGRTDDAADLFGRILEKQRLRLGNDHLQTLNTIAWLGWCEMVRYRPAAALPFFEEALRGRRQRLGSEHPHTLISIHNLGDCYNQLGRIDEAIPLLEESLAGRRKVLGADNAKTFWSINSLVSAYSALGRLQEARELLKDGYERQKKLYGADFPNTIVFLTNLAENELKSGNLEQAEPLLKEAYETVKNKRGPKSPNAIICQLNLAECLFFLGKRDDAASLLENGLAIALPEFGASSPITIELMALTINSELAAGNTEEAKANLEKLTAAIGAGFPPDSVPLATQLIRAAGYLSASREFTQAEKLLRELIEILDRGNPQAWELAKARSLLGECEFEKKNYASAEPLLVSGLEGLTRDQAKVPPLYEFEKAQAAARLEALFEATDRPDDAQRMKELQQKLPDPATGN